MQLSDCEKRRIEIRGQTREIEGELFLLASRSGETDVGNVHRFERLCEDRTQLARELLLSGHRQPFLLYKTAKRAWSFDRQGRGWSHLRFSEAPLVSCHTSRACTTEYE